jgi:hypothetical protein
MPAPITPLPDPPSRADPTNFATRGDAFLGALPTFQTELNAYALDLPTEVAAQITAALGTPGNVITSPTINGIVTTTGLTLPAVTLGGAVTGGSQNVSGLGTLGCGAITSTGQLSVTKDGLVAAFAPTTATAAFGYTLSNDGTHRALIYKDNSTGNGVWGSGGSAYSLNIGTLENYPVNIGVNNGIVATFGSSTPLALTKATAGNIATFANTANSLTAAINSSTSTLYFGDSTTNDSIGFNPTTHTAVVYCNGSLISTTSSTGLSVTGTTSSSGRLIFTGNDLSSAGEYAIASYTAGNAMFYNVPTGKSHQFGVNNSTVATLDASGNLLVGQTATGYQNSNSSYVGGGAYITSHYNTADLTTYLGFGYNSNQIGSILQSGTTAVTFNTTSDRRLKENVRPADALRFMDIEFVDFEWVDGRHDCGVIADQLASVYPDLVVGEKDATEIRTIEITPAVPAVTEQQLVTEAVLNDDGEVIEPATYETVEITPAIPAVTEDKEFPVYQQVNYIGLIGRMGTTVQKQQRMIEALEARLAALEAA